MERQGLLELLEDSDDPDQREACRVTAKWIKHFLGTTRDYILDMEKADRNPEQLSDPDYMARDSSGKAPTGTDS